MGLYKQRGSSGVKFHVVVSQLGLSLRVSSFGRYWVWWVVSF